LAVERGELEKSTIKAATDCVAQAALNNENIVRFYRENRLKQVTDWIVLKSSACDNPLRAMRLLHDRIYGSGTGQAFLLGAYLSDLPRAVRERIEIEVARRIASNPEIGGSHARAYQGDYDSSLLNHNGSIMSLIEGGNNSRTIYYRSPRPLMAELGVTQGTVLFQGHEIDGRWFGTAYVFKWGCPPIPYRVEGSLQQDDWGGWYVHLRGPAPVEYGGCTPISYSWTHNSELIFQYLSF
jgi:hypothetical protein